MNNYEISRLTTLQALKEQKAKLRDELQKEEGALKTDWNSLFHPTPQNQLLPSSRFSSWASIGTGIFDGIMLGLKLYRKFKKK